MTTILAILMLAGAFAVGFLVAAVLAAGKADDAYRRGLRDGNPFTPLTKTMNERAAYLRRLNGQFTEAAQLETTWRDGTDD